MSPLRMKQNDKAHNGEEKASSKFYAEGDSSDLEKVVMCSVISSGRPEGDESL